MNWYLKVWKQYADFSGRARRTEYWMFYLFNVIIIFLFCIVAGIVAAGVTAAAGDASLILFMVMIPLIIYGLAVFIPDLAVTVRRLHDTGKSGWWFFIQLIPMVGGIWLLVLLCMDSEPGTNKWGDNPKRVGYNLQDFEKY